MKSNNQNRTNASTLTAKERAENYLFSMLLGNKNMKAFNFDFDLTLTDTHTIGHQDTHQTLLNRTTYEQIKEKEHANASHDGGAKNPVSANSYGHKDVPISNMERWAIPSFAIRGLESLLTIRFLRTIKILLGNSQLQSKCTFPAQ